MAYLGDQKRFPHVGGNIAGCLVEKKIGAVHGFAGLKLTGIKIFSAEQFHNKKHKVTVDLVIISRMLAGALFFNGAEIEFHRGMQGVEYPYL